MIGSPHGKEKILEAMVDNGVQRYTISLLYHHIKKLHPAKNGVILK